MIDLIEHYLEWCEAASFSRNTVDAKRQALGKAHRTMPNGLLATDREVTRYIGNDQWSPATKCVNFVHLKGFYDWCIDQGELDYSPMTKMRRPRVPARLPSPWSYEELAYLLAKSRQPFRLAVVLASFAGLRCCEIVQVSPSNTDGQVIRVRGKGGKVAEVDVHPRVAQELSLFPGAGPYIVQAGGRADPRWLSKTSSWYFRTQLMLKAHLHQGRHFFVTGVYETAGEVAAQQAARHSSIVSTMGYTLLRHGQRRTGILKLPVPVLDGITC